jgi:YVTN family beta-propeller protein
VKPLPILLLLVLAIVAACAIPVSAGYTGYVACSTSDDVIPFEVSSYITDTPIPLPASFPYPYDATMNADTTEVWVADASGDHAVVIDIATNAITHTIPVGEYPNSVVFIDHGSTALVSSRDDDNVTLIKTSDYSVTGTLPVMTGSGGTYDGPGQLALNPISGVVYAVDWYDDTLFEIDQYASSVLRSVDIGNSMWQVVCDPNGAYVYITDRGDDVVRVVDTTTLEEVTTLPVGDDPWGLDVTIEGSKMVVACEDDATVYIFDTSDWSSTVIQLPSDADPRDVDILEDQRYAFVPSGDISGTDVVYVIDLNTDSLLTSFEVGGDPNCIAVEPQMWEQTAGVNDADVAALRLECHPNPFNPKTVVSYFVPESCEATLLVYDAAGRKVATLVEGHVEAGEHDTSWNGRTDDDRSVATGVYFMKLEALGTTKTAKSVLLK